MDISDKLRYYRKQNNLTQQELADKLHVSRKTISSWENGRGYPDINSITQLSEVFGISTDNLLKDDHLLEHYEEQSKQNRRADKLAKITYYLNLILMVISYCNLFDFLSINGPMLMLLSLANVVLFFSTYADWDRYKKNVRLVVLTVTFFILLMVNASVIPLNNQFFQLMKVNNQVEKLGGITGEVFNILLRSTCLTVIIFFYPHKSRKKKNDSKLTQP
ncbi:helix-turn-helix domain-containing protein [Lentilactobacillus raoultii]|uniref:Helix-turn-helix domain-containing protein n=1 Tax=Lentilactobacillus raoultii TaxID=1987503 RepID=A0ABW3PKQ5_9LACO|nr:helix-turn-helix transcriptional regulator [Lentilactobacillus raoultii]